MRHSTLTTTALRVLLVLAAGAACDRWMAGGATYRVGHDIVVWHQPPAHPGGFLPWAFRVTTPRAGETYVALERVGSDPQVLAEAPLPSGAKWVPLTLDVDPQRRAVLRVGTRTRFDVAAPLPLCCDGPSRFVANPNVLPQDSVGAIVLQYAISERLAASDSGSFATARRVEGASYLRLRFGVRR
ncbi:hypothetical protein J421_5919 (plasmid) [Gemmatirosa kalamazoonensis]|uniref:Uncharacterized protein n=1 Tax=Gemmatirosa kalamazoonensis TaxID=861299 RepID=W0RR42_9BACT|nr:hypothetical protein [Gemmatirosa kalamazoonensis]AHG93454.1 hypothetical protein J421_5919 [Gemmatirosa kalamazoonensis]